MKPNRTQIRLCEAILLQEAYRDTMRGIVDDIYNDVMRYELPQDKLVCKHTGEKITHHRDLYKYDGDCSSYYEECQIRLKEEGYPPAKPGCCPALEADCVLRDTQKLFVKACCEALPPQVDMIFEQLWEAPHKCYVDFLDINMRYVVQFVDTDSLKAKARGAVS